MATKGLLVRLAVLLVLVPSVLAVAAYGSGAHVLEPRDPIYIHGDDEFTPANGVVSGCGTANDPYIIEGWHIVPTLAGYGIYIDHTSSYFIIRHCAIEEASGNAILLNSVTHGRIENCLLLSSDTGLRLENARDNVIARNLFAENRYGAVMAVCSEGNILTQNSFLGNLCAAQDPERKNHWCWEGKGNYWCSHACPDRDGDGIIDQAYAAVGDPCPLAMSPIVCSLPFAISGGDCATNPILTWDCGGGCVACLPSCAPFLEAGPSQMISCARPSATLVAQICVDVPLRSIEWAREGYGVVGTTSCIVVDQPGTYVVTITGISGCSVSDSLVVTQDAVAPWVSVTSTGDLSCAVEQTTLTAAVESGKPPYTLEWRGPDGTWIGGEASITVSRAGAYTLTATGANGCSASTSFFVAQSLEAPTVKTAVEGPITCASPEVVLSSTTSGGVAPYLIEWFAADGTGLGTSETISVAEPGIYSVTATGANGCTATASVAVEEDTAAPAVDAGFDQIVTCAQPVATLEAAVEGGRAPFRIEWTAADGTAVGETASVQVAVPGTYRVTVTGANGCAASDTVAVLQDVEVPVVEAVVDHPLSCLTPEAALTVYVDGTSLPSSAEWRGPTGELLGTTASVTVTAPGEYSVTVIGMNGCSASATVVVEEDLGPPTVQAFVDGVLSCELTEVTLRAEISGGRPPYAIEWRNPRGEAVGSGSLLTVSEPGSYEVTAAGTNGCPSTASVLVQQDIAAPAVEATAGGVLTCAVTEIELHAEVSGGRPPFAYEWTKPSGGSAGTDPTISVVDPGSYTITVTGTNGCSTSASVIVEQDVTVPVVDAGPDQLLTADLTEITLTATVSDCASPCSVTWFDVDGNIVGETESIRVSRAGVYRVTAVAANGCSASDEVTVDSTVVREVMLESSIEGLAVFGQLTMDGVPIPESIFCFRVEASDLAGEAAVATIRLADIGEAGFEADGAEIAYIIPGNAMVRFSIHKEQFIVGKKYYLLHLPTDPPGEASVAFF
ncbi:MAG: right-handed parallel beta-helix repeat-containing protein [Candidatus Bipolaricaulota bacterium]|nr:MAG: right-handed parallel beta-helix repeat-containing protein [Candidatus Bipolaricaulota bacterium]